MWVGVSYDQKLIILHLVAPLHRARQGSGNTLVISPLAFIPMAGPTGRRSITAMPA